MDGLKIDFGDGVSALERTMRTIVLMTSQAIARLEEAGYVRTEDYKLCVHEDGIPIWIELSGKRVWETTASVSEGQVLVAANWLVDVKRKRRSFWSWLFRRK